MPTDDDLRACFEAGRRDAASTPIRPSREACEQIVRLLLAAQDHDQEPQEVEQ